MLQPWSPRTAPPAARLAPARAAPWPASAAQRPPQPALSYGEKGSENSLTLVPLILLRRAQMGRVDHEFRQRAAEAAMNTFGQFRAMRGAEQVEISGVVPVQHAGDPVEQRHSVPLRHYADSIQVSR